MNLRRVFVIALLAPALLVIFGCGTLFAPEPTATPEPTDTPEPTATPTATPTPTPTPTPTAIPIEEVDLSGVTLTTADMPAGFTEMPLGAATETGIGEMQTANQFAFQMIDPNTAELQLVIGFVAPVTSDEDQAEMEAMLLDPAALDELVTEAMGAELPITSQEPLTGVDDIGDLRTGTSITTTMSGLPIKVDMLVFERGRIAVIVMNFYTETITPAITIQDLGRILDQRAQEALGMP